MFQKTYVRLTIVYLAIMMVISLFFSGIIYQSSVQEIGRQYQAQIGLLDRLPPGQLSRNIQQQYLQERQEQYLNAKGRLLGKLIITNFGILLGGGILCYFLARRSLQPIEEAHAALERFTADASHELRTPLTAMRSEIEVALMNPKLTAKEAKIQLQSNLEELVKLTALSEGLLRLARLGSSPLEMQPHQLRQIAESATTRVNSLAAQKHITIQNNIPKSIAVTGDEQALVELLVIVLDNAIKYSPPSTNVILNAKKDHKTVKINIADQGPGIERKDLPHIFERFYRADSSRNSNETQGYGLGLSIAQNIVSLHSGAISIGSNKPKGSIVNIDLPTG